MFEVCDYDLVIFGLVCGDVDLNFDLNVFVIGGLNCVWELIGVVDEDVFW